jgi:hypothetical protein
MMMTDDELKAFGWYLYRCNSVAFGHVQGISLANDRRRWVVHCDVFSSSIEMFITWLDEYHNLITFNARGPDWRIYLRSSRSLFAKHPILAKRIVNPAALERLWTMILLSEDNLMEDHQKYVRNTW